MMKLGEFAPIIVGKNTGRSAFVEYRIIEAWLKVMYER